MRFFRFYENKATQHKARDRKMSCSPANGSMFEPSEAWRSTWRSDLLFVGRGATRTSSKPRPRRLAECQSRSAQRLEGHNKNLQWLVAAQSPGAISGPRPLLPLGGERNSTDECAAGRVRRPSLWSGRYGHECEYVNGDEFEYVNGDESNKDDKEESS